MDLNLSSTLRKGLLRALSGTVTQYMDGTGNWSVPGGGGGGSGDVVGPASSTDNAIVRFDGTTGKLLKDSLVTMSDLGTDSIYIGEGAGNATLSGSANTTFGALTANAHTSASNNTLIGYGAGKIITTSGSNVFVGHNSGSTNVGAGGGNVGVGLSACAGVSSGEHNTGLGYVAMDGLIGTLTGIYNISIGSQAGRGLNAGADGNITIGAQSQAASLQGDNNILIGREAATTLSTGRTNAIAIGYQAAADTDNSFSVGNSSVTLWKPGADAVVTLGSSTKGFKGIYFDHTTTAVGTTGNRTINKPVGRVNIAASGTAVTVTNSLVTADSCVIAQCCTNDTTAYVKNVVPASGSFVINLGAAATAEVAVQFLVRNTD